MNVIRVTISDLPDKPMYVLPTMREIQGALETMLDGHPVLDGIANFNDTVTVTFTADDVTEAFFDSLEAWEV
jgi:uncharacterized protein YggE